MDLPKGTQASKYRHIVKAPDEERNVSRWAAERDIRNDGSVACRQGYPKVLPEKFEKLGLERKKHIDWYNICGFWNASRWLEQSKTIINNSMMNWKIKLISGGTNFWANEHQKKNFSRRLLIATVAITPLPLILSLQNMRAGFRFVEDMELIYHLLFMNDLKLGGSAKNN